MKLTKKEWNRLPLRRLEMTTIEEWRSMYLQQWPTPTQEEYDEWARKSGAKYGD